MRHFLKPMGNVAKFGALLHFCHIYLVILGWKIEILQGKTLKPWCFSQLCSMTWLGYLPAIPLLEDVKQFILPHADWVLLKRGVGGLLGEKRTYPSTSVVNPKKILLMEEISKQPPGMYKTCRK